jgi:hypothetical protein
MASTEEQHEPIPINIGNICEGALVEGFAIELDKVLKNIMDPSTSFKTKRRITMTVEFSPKEDRVQTMAEVSFETKLASMIPAVSRIFVGKDEAGVLYALDEDPRQMHIFTPPKPEKAPAVIQFSSGTDKK